MKSFICFITALLLLIPFLSIGQDWELNYEPQKIRKKIRKIADNIGDYNQIHAELIGYAGETTKQYKRFEHLEEKANIDELVRLVEHPQPAVRGYAFWALARKHYLNLEEVFIAHLNDNELVLQIEGCLGVDMPVIEFMRWVVTPQIWDIDCKKLPSKVLEKVSSTF